MRALWSSVAWPCCSLFSNPAPGAAQVIRVAKSPLAKHFQRSFGDPLIATAPGNVASVETKAQRPVDGQSVSGGVEQQEPGRPGLA